MYDPPVGEAVSPLVIEFLSWIASRPRTYAEAMDAWRSHCPRHPVWDDALNDGLIEVGGRGGPGQPSIVALTPKGRALLTPPSE
jgi:hypothetical protein